MDRLRLLAETQGYFTRPDALIAGYDDKAIARALRAKLWTRIRQGVYTDTDVWLAADEVRRHRIASHAVVSRLGPGVAMSHSSAALHHGIALWGVDLGTVHVTRIDKVSGRTEAGVAHHEGSCGPEDLVEIDGLLATTPARAALEAAMLGSPESAVVTLDSALHRHCSRDELDDALGRLDWWPGSRRLQIATRLADGRSESVGESRSRYLFFRFNLPAPELQYEVIDHDRHLIGRVDFAWPEHRLLAEFDGRIKYGRLLRPGESAHDAVFREKRREDQLRELTQWSMVRLTWADLEGGARTAERIRRLLKRAA